MNKKRAFRVTIILLILLLLLLAAFFPRIYNQRPDWEHLPLVRVRNTAAVGLALSKYQYDHNGNLPYQLSELIPQYLPLEKIKYLFSLGYYEVVESNNIVLAD